MALGQAHIVAITALRRGLEAMPKDTDSMLKLGEATDTLSWRDIVKAIVASPEFFVAVGKAAQLARDGASEQDIIAQMPQLFTQAAMNKVEATVASAERRLDSGENASGRKYVPDLADVRRRIANGGAASGEAASVLSREPATAGRKYTTDWAAALRAKRA